MTDLTNKSVEELLEYNSYDGFRTIENCITQEAAKEIARRLKEAQQRSEAHDAEVAAKALKEPQKLLSEMYALILSRDVQFVGNLHGGIWTWPDRAKQAAEYHAKARRKE